MLNHKNDNVCVDEITLNCQNVSCNKEQLKKTTAAASLSSSVFGSVDKSFSYFNI